jgi:hypothetical protein
MADKKTIRAAEKDRRQGKSPSTQAGEFVHREIDKIRQGEHGARSAKQAIAIGLSEARRAGVPLPPPKKGRVSEKTRRNAKRAYEKGRRNEPISKKRSHAATRALKREGRNAVSSHALSRQSHNAAMNRAVSDRSAAGKKGAKTKGPRERFAAAKKATRTRAHKNERP